MRTRQVSVAKTFEFDSAHRLRFHQGKCKNLHGHTYRVEVEFEGPMTNRGSASNMVIDFGVVSDIVRKIFYDGVWCGKEIVPFDHSVMLHEEDPLTEVLEKAFPDFQILKMTEEPTAEYIATFMVALIEKELEYRKLEYISVAGATVWETPTSKATYRGNWDAVSD